MSVEEILLITIFFRETFRNSFNNDTRFQNVNFDETETKINVHFFQSLDIS